MSTVSVRKPFSSFAVISGGMPGLPASAPARLAQFLVILLSAMALKQHYSTASVNELRWILAPTTWLVQLATSQSFTFESNAGYMNSDHTFLIAASCAGVNFLITAFLMLSLRQLWLARFKTASWSFLPVTALAAYLATIITNAFRIVLALQMRLMDIGASSSGVTRAEMHRLEGIFVYFGFLLLLFVASDGVSRKIAGNSASTSSTSKSLGSLIKDAWFPLLIYYTTTLAFPVLNAACHGRNLADDFWKHSGFVCVTPLLVLLTLVAVRWVWVCSRESRSEISNFKSQISNLRSHGH